MRKHCGNCANNREETNQFSEECGKCVSARLENGETTDPSHWREKPKTNADRIRAMSDEELTKLLNKIVVNHHIKKADNCNHCPLKGAKPCDTEGIIDWLKQPAEVE